MIFQSINYIHVKKKNYNFTEITKIQNGKTFIERNKTSNSTTNDFKLVEIKNYAYLKNHIDKKQKQSSILNAQISSSLIIKNPSICLEAGSENKSLTQSSLVVVHNQDNKSLKFKAEFTQNYLKKDLKDD